MTRLASRLALAGALVLVAAIAAAAFQIALPWRIERTIDPMDIHPLRGHAHAVTLAHAPGWPLFEFRGDTFVERRSRLRLFENGTELPMPHAMQPAVESLGGGRYLHLRESELYFSTPDDSLPRTNGRSYSYRSPVMLRAGVTFSLFAIGAALLGAAVTAGVGRRQAEAVVGAGMPRLIGNVRIEGRVASAAFVAGTCALAVAWLALTWQPAPLVVDTGDGGTVASIAAGRLDRAAFADDPVLADPSTTAFYVSASVALTAALARLTGDVGQAYLLPIVAILVVQLLGFFRLGVRLYDHRGWAALVAALSIPPVYVFVGELWGLLAMPLPRALFGALLPWLLLGLLDDDPKRARWRPHAMMLACGASAWVHPVSAPSVAFGAWLAFAAQRPEHVGWRAHSIRMVFIGLVFLACVVPIALWLFGGFASAAGDAEARALGERAVRAATGPQYFDVRKVLRAVVGNGWGWVWLVWIGGLIGLLRPRRESDALKGQARTLRWFLVGLLIASIGAAALDQWVARFLGRGPLQIDLVRNVRFVVPLLLLGIVWFLADLWRASCRPRDRAAIVALVVLLLAGWWHRHPTPPVIALASIGERSVDEDGDATRRMLRRIGELPPGTRILPIGDSRSEGAVELTGLAVRYAAFRPVAFLAKDLNMLSYSGAGGIRYWFRVDEALRGLRDAPESDAAAGLQQVVSFARADYILLHAASLPDALVQSAAGFGRPVASEGPWRLIAAPPAKQ